MQVTPPFKFVTPTHATLIVCPYCQGDAHLAQRLEAITGDGKGELRYFECGLCQQQIDMFVRD